MPPGKVCNKEALVLQCEWEMCTFVVSKMEEFCEHVSKHLQQHLHGKEEEEDEVDSLEEYACLWQECGFCSPESPADLVRHVYFHCYHTKLKQWGLQALQSQSDLTACQLDFQSRNIIPEIQENFLCLWEYCEIMSGFQKLGFPHCIGAVDGTHVAICKFKGRGREYINRKKFNSILIQGTVDHTGRFIDAEVGWSGRNHDAFVFVNSAICTAMDAGVFVPGNPSLTIEGVTVPPLIISDAAYPMRRWLMKPFNRPHTPAEAYFDRCLTRARTIVERCFGRLKGRWRCLRSQLMVAEENVTCIATACVVLHNICELKGHGIPEDDSPVRPVEVDEESLELPVGDRRHREEGKLVRDALARHMFRNREI